MSPLLPEDFNTIDPIRFLDRFEELLEEKAVQYKEQLWNYYLHRSAEALSATEEELKNIFLNPDLYAFLVQCRLNQKENPVLRRAEILMREMRLIRMNSDAELNQCIAALREAISGKTIQVFGKSVSFAQVQQFLNHHSDRKKRREAAEAMRPALAALDRFWKQLISTRNRLAREAGFSDFTAFFMDQLEYRNSDLSEEPDADFTGEYYDLPYELAQQNQELNRTDFSPDRVHEAILQTLDAMGLNPEQWSLQTTDAGPDFPTICIPVHIPSDIRMLIGTGASFDAFAHLAREYGRACHYAHVRQDTYTLKSIPSVLSGISSELFYRFLVNQETVEAIINDRSYCAQWPQIEALWQKRQQRIFLCLSKFEEHMYQLPFEKLDDLWQGIYRRYWGFREPVIPDWKIQEWFLSRPFMALEQILSRQLADKIVAQFNESSSFDYLSEILTKRIFANGNVQRWEQTIQAFFQTEA